MRLYNTATRTVEDLTVRDNTVSMYVCGVTPYDTTHTGHAFTYVTFDTLARHLAHKGHEVHYVQNVTDIDDDVLRRAAELGEPMGSRPPRLAHRVQRHVHQIPWPADRHPRRRV